MAVPTDARAYVRYRPGSALALDLGGDRLHLVEHAQQVAAPQQRDLLLGVAASHQFQGHVECLGGIVSVSDAAAFICESAPTTLLYRQKLTSRTG